MVVPAWEAQWRPVKFNGSLEKASNLLLDPFGIERKQFDFLVIAQITALGNFIRL